MQRQYLKAREVKVAKVERVEDDIGDDIGTLEVEDTDEGGVVLLLFVTRHSHGDFLWLDIVPEMTTTPYHRVRAYLLVVYFNTIHFLRCMR